MGSVYDSQSIAIVGLSCRLPGDADNAERFWNLMSEGRSAISSVPADRWNSKGFRDPTGKKRQNTSLTDRAHFVKGDISEFDANFFTISKAEADSMDPQQRIMLEVAYEAFENAGLSMDSLAKSQTGCWVSSFSQDWKEMHFSDPDAAPKYAMSGMQPELLSNRVSYFFDLQGPSMTIETACSGSLVGLHVACQSLRAGDCETALVGGANLFLNQNMFLALSNQSFLAPDGLCKAFDASANGYGRGEGFAAVILKPIEKAIRDGDHIRAVIRGTGTNQDGRTKGLTMPNGHAQESLIRSTYAAAGLDLKDTAYFEAHGTGTQAGDFEELGAISRTVADARQKAGLEDLWVGSAKTNIGHLEAVAGLVGVLKAVLVLENGVIPPNLHFKNPNPRIPFGKWRIKVPTERIQWPSDGIRRVSVNSFGFGGSNAHAILDDADQYLSGRGIIRANGKSHHHHHQHQQQQLNGGNGGSNGVNGTSEVNGTSGVNGTTTAITNGSTHVNGTAATAATAAAQQIIILNSYDQEGLGRQREALLRYAEKQQQQQQQQGGQGGADPEKLLGDLAFTLNQKRSRLPWRTFFTASTLPELSRALEAASTFPAIRSGAATPRIAYVFTGQGAQWAQMGMDLLRFHVFRESVEAADRHLTQIGCPWSAVEELQRGDAESNIHISWYSQTLCTVIQVALVQLLESWNVRPRSVVGHSSGEMGAAFAIGALSREDAWTIAYWRGKLSSELTTIAPTQKGAMMAVGASHAQAQAWVDGLTRGRCVVACVNSPSSVTVSGDESGLDELAAMLKEQGVFARKLKVSTAYHSHHMKAVAEAYLDALKGVRTRTVPAEGGAPQMFTSVSESLVDPAELGPAHWVANLISPVLFSNTVRELARPKGPDDEASGSAVDLMVEIGPHAALRGPVTQILQSHGLPALDYYSVLSRGANSVDTALAVVGELVCRGVPVDLGAVNRAHLTAEQQLQADRRPSLVAELPPYAWNHAKTYWSESRISRELKYRPAPQLGLIGAPMPNFAPNEHQWRGFLRLADAAWIRDHKIQSSVIFPAGGFLAMAVEAAAQLAAAAQQEQPDRVVKGYKLRSVDISSAVRVADDSSVECIIQLRLSPGGAAAAEAAETWWDFSISTSPNAGEALKRNCSGSVAVEFGALAIVDAAQASYASAASACTISQEVDVFYRQLDSVGLGYGPTFQAIKSILHDSRGQGCGVLEITETDSASPKDPDARPHVVHPTTLESLFQMAYAAFGGRDGRVKRALMVTQIDELLVDATIPFAPGSRLLTSASAARQGFREIKADAFMLEAASESPKMAVKGLVCVEMPSASGMGGGGGGGLDADQASYSAMLSKFVWKPALELLSAPEQAKLLEDATRLPEDEAQRLASEATAELHAVKAVLESAQSKKIANLKLRNAAKWISQQLQASGIPGKPAENGAREGGSSSGFTAEVEKVLSGLAEADVLLGSKGSADHLVAQLPGMKMSLEKMYKLVNYMAHANPNLTVLEIVPGGAGVDFSLPLSAKDIPSTIQYTYASPSADNVQQMQERLGGGSGDSALALALAPRFRVLEIEQDLADQGLDPGSFDIVIGCNLLSNAVNVEKTLSQAKSLLTEGGKMALVELNKPSPAALPVLGILCDWWKRRDDGLRRPFTTDMVNESLAGQGFAIELATPDFTDPALQQSSLVLASCQPASAGKESAAQEVVSILVRKDSSEAVNALASQLSQACNGAKTVTWEAGVDFKGQHLISLLEFDTPLLDRLTEEDFGLVKQLITQAASLQWVTAIPEPHASTVMGLARVARFEVPSLRFQTVTLDPSSVLALDRAATLIIQAQKKSTSQDKEFKEVDSVLHVPRVDIDAPLNEQVTRLLLEEDVEPMPLGSGDAARKLCIRNPGMLNTLCFEIDSLPSTVLAEDEVEMQVKASGLSPKDVAICLGQVSDTALGFEASGIVTRVGAGVAQFQAGDKICMMARGAHRTVLRSKSALCQRIPEGMSFEQAAAVPLAHGAVYHALVNIARARSGQKILVAVSDAVVSEAAVQLAKHLGLEAFVTTESQDRTPLIGTKEDYGISDDHIFYSRDPTYVKEITRLTNGAGVDCVLSSVSGEALKHATSCLAPFGTFVDLGAKDVRSSAILDKHPEAMFAAINLERISELRPDMAGRIMDGTFALLREGAIKPVKLLAAYPASDLETAMQALHARSRQDKIVIAYSADQVVPVLHNPRESLRLPGDKTYLIAGGLGGIGRNIANLLVECGARHLAFVSRSGVTSEAQQKLVDNLTQRGAKIAVYRCNIGDAQSLEQTLARCSAEMPPVKGVIHSAVVFRDAVIHNMTYAQWHELMESKLGGSWNLHALTTSYDLDFFLCIGSFMAIIGGLSQSNYAAGGAFQDGLAHMRQSMGLPAATIDLGIVKGFGAVEEQGAVGHTLEWREPFGVDEDAVFALIKKALLGQMDKDGPGVPPQMINTVPTGGMVRESGVGQPYYFEDPRFAIMAAIGTRNADGADGQASVALKEQLAQAESPEEAARLVSAAVAAKVAKLMQVGAEEIDAGKPLHAYGVDSLVAIEYVHWAKKEVAAEITVFDVMASVPISAFASDLAKKGEWGTTAATTKQ
uniref:Partially reducing polyketide synthase men1 n=1 Tax=Menisporopsis theobromae TaxID=752604 RepID=MEN1_MENTH|nr:RecName: Full=Partially reducing polyketide synthase men1; Short=R-PKS men1 [Menisporopsis theobromae]CAB3277415.1 Men1 [Menisporopsis theobromae]